MNQPPFGKESDFQKYVSDAERAAQGVRYELARRVGIDQAFYEGIQWLGQSALPDGTLGIRMNTPSYPDLSPDGSVYRATVNHVTRFIHRSAATTFPEKIEVDVMPPARNTSMPKLNRMPACMPAAMDPGRRPIMRSKAPLMPIISRTRLATR